MISWLDIDFDGDDFTSFASVEISYRDAEDESATVTTESLIARTDHGKIITGLSGTIFYIFWVKYVNPGELGALPFIVGTRNINSKLFYLIRSSGDRTMPRKISEILF